MSNSEYPNNKVQSKEDFLNHVERLLQDLKMNPSSWQNITLADYLEGIRNWTEDMDGYYINSEQPLPKNVTWGTFADILTAAKIYE